MTGSRALAHRVGDQMFRFRQSSLGTAPNSARGSAIWIAACPNSVASRTPSQLGGGAGAAHRRSPTGAAA